MDFAQNLSEIGSRPRSERDLTKSHEIDQEQRLPAKCSMKCELGHSRTSPDRDQISSAVPGFLGNSSDQLVHTRCSTICRLEHLAHLLEH